MSLPARREGGLVLDRTLSLASGLGVEDIHVDLWHTGPEGLFLQNKTGNIIIADGQDDVGGIKKGNIVISHNVPGVGTRVGINLDDNETPAQLLHIKDTGANAAMQIDRTDGASIFVNATSLYGQFGTVSNHDLRLLTNSTSKGTISTAGIVTFPAIYTTPVTGGLQVVVGIDGKLGYNSCMEDQKENIEPADLAVTKKILEIPVKSADFGPKVGACTLTVEGVKNLVPEVIVYSLYERTEGSDIPVNACETANYSSLFSSILEPEVENNLTLEEIKPPVVHGGENQTIFRSAVIVKKCVGIDYPSLVPHLLHVIQDMDARLKKLEG